MTVTRADWEAATPKCFEGAGGAPCGRPLEWTTVPSAVTSDRDGLWCCAFHGPMLTGLEAAERAGWAPPSSADAA
jgi:hypothetical protein